MSRDANECHLGGRAGKDAARTGNGPYRFSIAQGGGKKRDSEERWPTEWYTVVGWPRDFPSGVDVRKGDSVEVWGRLKPTEWTKDNVKHTGIDIVASKIEITASKGARDSDYTRGTTNPPVRSEPSYAITAEHPITDEDIPFSEGRTF